jgi:polyhydroxybutyrate depolymerase
MSHGSVDSGAHELKMPDTVRRYVVIRPRGMDPASAPTIIDLHGSGSWPAEHVAVTGAETTAARGAVVVVPQAGIPFRLLAQWPEGWAWNVPDSPLPGETTARADPDDVAFLDVLVSRLVEQHRVDPRRIHLRGFSGGARLASLLHSAMADRLSSVCCVAGVRFVPSSGRLPPLLAMHGSLDSVNPYQGGGGPRWSESVESVIDQWAVAHGCGPPQYRQVADAVRETRYADAEGFAMVRLLTVADAAHSWPGTRHRDHIAQFGASGSFDATQAHSDFVREVDHYRRDRPRLDA